MSHQPTKMLVEAGIIPKNTLQELNRWRLLPEDYEESHGAHPVRLDTSKPDEVSRFVKELSVAITKDMAEIRETELDRSGSFRRARLEFRNESYNSEDTDVFVDRLGRLVTPEGGPWPSLERVTFQGDVEPRQVVKREQRYEGEKSVALVIYLEAQEDSNASAD